MSPWLATALAAEVRTDLAAPPLPEELEAARELRNRPCARRGALVPGLWELCAGREVEGATLLALSAAEVAAGVAVLALAPPPDPTEGIFDSGHLTFLLAASEPFVWSAFEMRRTTQLAMGLPYVPVESTAEIWSAPFRPKVFLRPTVLVGTLALAGGALALSAAIDDLPAPTFQPPNLLGAHPPPGLGYPAIGLLNAGLMLQVATAEELVFRGHVQSGLARSVGEGGGVVLGSLIFGSLHAANALLLAPEDRLPYLAFAVPWITLTGTWLSVTYHASGYELSPVVAGHFWYNTIVSTAGAVTDPERHLFSLRIGGPL